MRRRTLPSIAAMARMLALAPPLQAAVLYLGVAAALTTLDGWLACVGSRGDTHVPG